MLTHIDENNLPTMVDVTNKTITHRGARAQSQVQLPSEVRAQLQGRELHLKKGPVFQTAIIAGTMAVKKTHELIPFCHQVPIEGCKFDISIDDNLLVTITCEVKTSFKTGVEMEALYGASAAALCIYDMVKAVSHNIVIQETRLLTKTGGRHTILDRPLYGLVLTGGRSERMKKDKALINYKGKPHAQYIYDTLTKYCEQVYLSARKDQWLGTDLESLPVIEDSIEGEGPIAGILAAFEKHPEAHWFVVACDLIHFNDLTVQKLLANHQSSTVATAYKNADKDFPEPLCALYTPQAQAVFREALKNDIRCPVKVLRNNPTHVITQTEGINLANINTVEEFAEVQNEIR